jgi:hypothetical protein
MGRRRKGGGNEDRRVHFDEGELREWFTSGKTTAEIAAIVGCSTYPVGRALRRLGLRRKAAPRMGAMTGDKNPAWRGGRRVRYDGYVEVWTPDGPRLEHQCVMEQALGRKLVAGEVVHHIDRDKQNNELSNLELTTQSAHAREHSPEMHAARYGR